MKRPQWEKEIERSKDDIYYYYVFSHKGSWYRFNTMIFGLKDAPEHFTKVMNDILQDNPAASSYIDDILVASMDMETHIKDVEKLLNSLISNNVGISLKKCQWAGSSIKYLGCIISGDGLSVDESKLIKVNQQSTLP
jgi:hypothetical protein